MVIDRLKYSISYFEHLGETKVRKNRFESKYLLIFRMATLTKNQNMYIIVE